MRRLIKITTSFFYIGHSPFMPGTLGSLAGLLIYFVVKDKLPVYAFSLLFIFVLGILFSTEAEKNKKFCAKRIPDRRISQYHKTQYGI